MATVYVAERLLKSSLSLSLPYLQRINLTLAGSNSYPMEMTPLADAAARGLLGIVQVLVDSRAEVNAISEVCGSILMQ